MHELSLCESLLAILEEEARRQCFARVQRIRLEMGALSCAEPEAMRFCFRAVSRGTLAEDAALELIERPARARCRQCGRESQVRDRFAVCAGCGASGLAIESGTELRIRDLEVT